MLKYDLTLREQPSGGKPLEECYGPRKAFDARDRLILLVHGFNVSRDQAKIEQYLPFEMRLDQCGLKWDVAGVYWPADGCIPFVKNIQYPQLIKRAIECSFQFADYLKNLKKIDNSPCEIVLIGHSLGCRLILETLQVLANQSETNSTISITVILMGAAVPVALVESIDCLRIGLSIVKKAFVLYSRQDLVLSHAFPIGQSVSRDKIRDNEAVGLKGKPYNGLWCKRIEMSNYQHGHYWKKKRVPYQIASILGVPVAKQLIDRSSLPSRQLSSRNGSKIRVTIKSRNLQI
jgi:esterase/lipase superfamily enzyme